MTLDIFERMTNGVLALLGEDSFLRLNEPCKVAIEHGVETYGMDAQGNQVVYQRSIATFRKTMLPKSGDALTHPDGSYVLDVLHADDGLSVDFILRKV